MAGWTLHASFAVLLLFAAGGTAAGVDPCFARHANACGACTRDAACGLCVNDAGATKCMTGKSGGPQQCVENCVQWFFLDCSAHIRPTRCDVEPEPAKPAPVPGVAPPIVEPSQIVAAEPKAPPHVKVDKPPPDIVNILARSEYVEWKSLRVPPPRPEVETPPTPFEKRNVAEQGILSTQPVRDELIHVSEATSSDLHAHIKDVWRRDTLNKRLRSMDRQITADRKRMERLYEQDPASVPEAGATGGEASSTGPATGATGMATGATGATGLSDSDHWNQWSDATLPKKWTPAVVEDFHRAAGHESSGAYADRIQMHSSETDTFSLPQEPYLD